MAFDFLGTFTPRLWSSFRRFFITVFNSDIQGIERSAVTYDPQNHVILNQYHLPRVRDHQIAEQARLNQYYLKLSTQYNRRITSSTSGVAHAGYFIDPSASFPVTGSIATFSLAGTSPTPGTVEDSSLADAVLYLKTKVKKQIKAKFERDEFRLKRCFDFMDSLAYAHADWNLLNSDHRLYGVDYVIGKIENKIQESLAGATDTSVIPSLIDNTSQNNGNNIDGEDLEFSANSTRPRKLIYRGVLLKLHRVQKPIESPGNDNLANLNALFKIQDTTIPKSD